MLTVTPIPAFNDNYLWMIESDHECWVVDPGDAVPVQTALSSNGRELTGILVTHHHNDHIGGIADLIKPGMPVIGPSISRFHLVNDPVSEGDIRNICGQDFRVIDVPGHTLNHIAYFAETADREQQKPRLFCGDTLFAGGCGRLFEGTPEQMHHSLKKLSALDPDTLIYCAHEYTLANLAFALSIEPNNLKLKQHVQNMQQLRDQQIPTLPSTIQIEIEINPFLRTHSEEICKSAMAFDSDISSGISCQPVGIFAAIRRMKDQF